MSATRNGSGGAAAPGGRSEGPFDEARFLTIGQAADLLGVAHVTLRQWVRAGRIVTHPGRLGGLAVDLVRAGDLLAIDPLVRQRGLPRASGVKLAGSSRPSQTGRHGATATRPQLVRPSDGPATGGAGADWSTELARELERLRGELADERARGRARAAELEAVERDLRRLLARPISVVDGALDGGTGDVSVHTTRLAAAAGAARSAGAPRRGLPLLALLPALVLGFVARPWLAPRGSVVDTSGGTRIVQASNSPALDAPVPEAPASEAPASEAPASEAPASEAPASEAPASDVAPAVAIDGESAERRAEPVEPEVALDTAPDAPHTEAAADATRCASSGDFAGRLSARELRPLEYAAVDGPACAFGGHAADLGPCMGPPTRTGSGVAGTHRVDGVDCCRHHQLAQRLGGDLAQLAATAERARHEGVLPPLLAARIDRAIGPFLRARFGAWRAAGVDDVQGAGHHVELDAEGTATVETWIELEQHEPAGAAPATASYGPHIERRDVRLVLEVSDSAEGDVLRELVTLKGPSAVATGGALVQPGADQPTAENDR